VRRVAALLLIGVAAAGCGGGGGSDPAPKPSPNPNPHAAASGEAVIRAWTKAVYDGDYGRAADLFAHRAIVQQGVTFVLTSRARAVAFNRSLPCRARVTGIEREPHGLLLASFELLPGRAGGCPDGGSARVRFMIRGGRIETWRQLPQAPGAPSQSV
jgi:hypothetical protein